MPFINMYFASWFVASRSPVVSPAARQLHRVVLLKLGEFLYTGPGSTANRFVLASVLRQRQIESDAHDGRLAAGMRQTAGRKCKLALTPSTGREKNAVASVAAGAV
jgi:hypothetical protein